MRRIDQVDARGEADASWFAPDIDGNREDPEPFEVLILPASGEDIRRLEADNGKMHHGQAVNFMRRQQSVEDMMLERRVLGVRGYEVRDKRGNIIRPTNGRELLGAIKFESAAAAETIRTSILEAIKSTSVLAEGARPKSTSHSGSLSPGTATSGNGSAGGAETSRPATS